MVHLGSNCHEVSMRGLHNNTKSQASLLFSLTFFYLYMLLFHSNRTIGCRLLSCALILADL
jgi:hypothetical protein